MKENYSEDTRPEKYIRRMWSTNDKNNRKLLKF